MIVLSGGLSATKDAFTQFGSAGAETRVGALVGVTAGVSVVSGLSASGVCVAVGKLEISVRDSPA
jgi:hypothetical protein